MAYYLIRVDELPYPHAMGVRWPEMGGPSNCPMELAQLKAVLGTDPGQDGYRELFGDPAMVGRRQSCHVHEGDWTIVLATVQNFLAPFPATADPVVIEHASLDDPRIAGLAEADRRLARSLVHAREHIKYVVKRSGSAVLDSGQHRTCWARTAEVAAMPVWFDAATAAPPRDAVLLQRG